MTAYSNHSGNSGVTGYAIGTNYIDIQFQDGAVYRYNYSITGTSYVEQMKQLAIEGKGLSSFISRYVKDNYAMKIN